MDGSGIFACSEERSLGVTCIVVNVFLLAMFPAFPRRDRVGVWILSYNQKHYLQYSQVDTVASHCVIVATLGVSRVESQSRHQSKSDHYRRYSQL
jgi:hypothetical protein